MTKTPIEQAKAALESVEATLKNRGEEWTRDGINYISEALAALSTIEGSGEPVTWVDPDQHLSDEAYMEAKAERFKRSEWGKMTSEEIYKMLNDLRS